MSDEAAATTDGPESFVVRIDTGDRIHYLDWGEPAERALPPLLLLHGIAQTGWIWVSVARRLRALTRVIAPDLRGHGLSDAVRTGYDLDSLAIDMLTVLTANGWGKDADGPPVVLAGHGFGAMVAVTMAGMAPDSVAGVALLDGGWEEMGQATGLGPGEFLTGLAEPPEILGSMDTFLADRRDFDPETWDADQERAARAQVDEKHAGHVGLVSRPAAMRGVVDAMFDYRPEEALVKVAAPMVVLVAEAATADDEGARERRIALDDAVAARGRAGLADTRVVRFPGAGHNLMRYRGPEVVAELSDLLRRAATSADGRGDLA